MKLLTPCPDNYYQYTIQKRRSDETLREDQRNKQLLKAAAAGHTPRVKYLLQLGADLDFSDDEAGFTALHHAALSGFEDTVEFLLEQGADVAARALDHGSPLHLAALKGRCNVVKALLRSRADANEENEAVGWPLHCACAAASEEVVQELLAHGSVVDHVAWVDFRLMYSELVLRKDDWRTRRWGCPPLLLAATSGSRLVCEMLLAAGASSDTVSHYRPVPGSSLDARLNKALPQEPYNLDPRAGLTPFRSAIRYGHVDVARLMLLKGVPQDAVDECFIMAAYLGQTAILLLLLDLVDSPDMVSGDQGTPLMCAVSGGDIPTAQTLLDAGASVNLCWDGPPARNLARTALHAAIQADHPGMVSMLLTCGGDPLIPNAEGRDCRDMVQDMLRIFPSKKSCLSMQDMIAAAVGTERECAAPGEREYVPVLETAT